MARQLASITLLAAATWLVTGATFGQPPAKTHAPQSAAYPYAQACPAAGREDVVDRWLMYECNCTSYVAWALAANHQRVDWFVPGRMDARNWPDVARAHGIETGSTARVGAVAVWPRLAPPFGHIAYVVRVAADHTFDVAEYNLPRSDGSNSFAFDRRSGLRPSGATFIYVPHS
jgi:surface antigen